MEPKPASTSSVVPARSSLSPKTFSLFQRDTGSKLEETLRATVKQELSIFAASRFREEMKSLLQSDMPSILWGSEGHNPVLSQGTMGPMFSSAPPSSTSSVPMGPMFSSASRPRIMETHLTASVGLRFNKAPSTIEETRGLAQDSRTVSRWQRGRLGGRTVRHDQLGQGQLLQRPVPSPISTESPLHLFRQSPSLAKSRKQAQRPSGQTDQGDHDGYVALTPRRSHVSFGEVDSIDIDPSESDVPHRLDDCFCASEQTSDTGGSMRGPIPSMNRRRYGSKFDSITRGATVSFVEEEGWWIRLVTHSGFDIFMALLVMLNCVLLGWEVNYMSNAKQLPHAVRAADLCFCGAFCLEVVFRIAAMGLDFFTNDKHQAWNLFDLGVVLLQLVGEIAHAMGSFVNVRFAILRIMRLFRVVRKFTRLRFFEELGVALRAMYLNWKPLLCSMLILFMTIYMFSVFFLQFMSSGSDLRSPTLMYWFDGLGRTMLTLFECLFGGVSWDEVVAPIVLENQLLGVLFCFYISVGILAILNLVTSIFVESVMKTALEEKDTLTAVYIAELFLDGGDVTREISRDEFVDRMESPKMQDYFASMGMQASEASLLFELLDFDDLGSVDANGIVTGCMALRGSAKGIDVAALIREVSLMQLKLDSLILGSSEASRV